MPASPPQFSVSRPRRRGTVYLLVMGTTIIVALAGMAGLMTLRIQRQSMERAVDASLARLYAQAAIEIGMHQIASDSNWRTTYSNGVWITERSVGNGTFDLSGEDPTDADLSDGDTDSILLTGIGKCGAARQKISVGLVPKMRGVEALESTLHAGGQMSFVAATFVSNGLITSNDRITASVSQVTASGVRAVNSISGTTFNGTLSTGIESRSMPSDSLFDVYSVQGTFISTSSLPSLAGIKMLQNLVLSSSSNPYGTANSQGIYVIDCGGLPIQITNVRIVGTLLLLEPGIGSSINGSINWTSAISNYPTLLVRGDMELSFGNGTLTEADLPAVNFNPAGTPYQGSSDTDTNDTYPSIITGLVYASGSLSLLNHPTIKGSVIVGGDITVNESCDLTYDNEFYSNPPPGFLDTRLMNITPGSWKRGVD